ncbi:thiaminase II [Sporosarcina limicola]|uniref:Aminopyrimidine aminohydrolase n=1 Tax=Sporosarcina limicola TaxID=34101 RepID=A0A927ML31_9BACL|nr:thiaminase II [Sporosarcina limicola]MBE1553181.1 thiaminase/transcriptional activator TenA [Sporosarcina limicola]
MTFCEEVRKECDDLWQGSFDHPFIKQIAEGILPEDVFKYYVKQDSYYLQHFAKVHALAAVKAKGILTTQRFAQHAEITCGAEIALHEHFFEMLDVTDEELATFQPAPTAYDYTSHLYRVAFEGDLADILAALLPCYWLYYEIGERLKGAKPNHPVYDKWIQTYGSEWFENAVMEQITRMNELAEGLSTERREELKEHFRKSSYYEWHFWEMAWTKQAWAIGSYELTRNK